MSTNTLQKVINFLHSTSYDEKDIHFLEVLLNKPLQTLSVDEIKMLLEKLLENLTSSVNQPETEDKIISETSTNAIETNTVTNSQPSFQASCSLYPVDTVTLDSLSLQQIYNMGAKMTQKLAEHLPLKCAVYKSMKANTKTQIIYNKLKSNQRIIFEKIHRILSESLDEIGTASNEKRFLVINPKSMYLDSSPGTGKTFVMSSLAQTLTFDLTAIVYQRILREKLRESGILNTETCCKYLIDHLESNYKTVTKEIFKDEYSIEKMAYKMYRTILKLRKTDSLLIVDEYTVLSPWIIVCLMIGSLRLKFNIIFTGDKNQHNAISKSIFHNQSNYTILEFLCDYSLSLDEQMRITDNVYNTRITEIKRKLNLKSALSTVPLTFDIVFYLFYTFKPKYFAEERLLDIIYMTQYHKNIKKRIYKIEAYCNKIGKPFYRIPFQTIDRVEEIAGKNALFGDNIPVLLGGGQDLFIEEDHPKFLDYFLIIPGVKYNWVGLDHQTLVTVVNVEADSIIVQSCDEACHTFVLRREKVLKNSLPEEYYRWLKSNVNLKSSIYQFPLRILCTTYHAAQGLTLNNDIVELDVDTMTANSIYVGLSRVRQNEQIHALRTKHLTSLMFTLYMNDEYYYKIYRPNKRLLENLLLFIEKPSHRFDVSSVQFATVNKETFEKPRHRYCVRVPRLEYENTMNLNLTDKNVTLRHERHENHERTPLLLTVDFFKRKFHELFDPSCSIISEESFWQKFQNTMEKINEITEPPLRKKNKIK